MEDDGQKCKVAACLTALVALARKLTEGYGATEEERKAAIAFQNACDAFGPIAAESADFNVMEGFIQSADKLIMDAIGGDEDED